mmetsp:Transcript_229/g.929  ORF Transcript_229/g.929 Transcript_229/m.929 type:complete len:232 (+) Transcript_229:1504-2199(+)
MSSSVADAMTEAREHRSERMRSPKLALSARVSDRSSSPSSTAAESESSLESESYAQVSSASRPLEARARQRRGQSSRNARREDTHAWMLLSRVWKPRVSKAASAKSPVASRPESPSRWRSRARAARTSAKHARSFSSAYHRNAPDTSVSTASACSRANASRRRSTVPGNAATYASRSAAKTSPREEECMTPLSGAIAVMASPRSRATASRSVSTRSGRNTTMVSSSARRVF